MLPALFVTTVLVIGQTDSGNPAVLLPPSLPTAPTKDAEANSGAVPSPDGSAPATAGGGVFGFGQRMLKAYADGYHSERGPGDDHHGRPVDRLPGHRDAIRSGQSDGVGFDMTVRF